MNKLDFKYPHRFTFNLVRNIETGEQFVSAQPTNNQKVAMRNIKYVDVCHFSLESNKRVALLDVREIKSNNELLEWLARYEEIWEIRNSELVDGGTK